MNNHNGNKGTSQLNGEVQSEIGQTSKMKFSVKNSRWL